MQEFRTEQEQIYNSAQKLTELVLEYNDISFDIIDDGCHERAEAIVSIGILNNIEQSQLSRVFLVNTSRTKSIEASKPTDVQNDLNSWFSREKKQIVSGASFTIDNEVFRVDSFEALRADSLASIYLDSSPQAIWGVGHVAPMVGQLIIDPALSSDPILFRNWKEDLMTDSVIPLKAEVGQIPEIDFNLLSFEEAKRVLNIILNELFIQNITGSSYLETNLIDVCKNVYDNLNEDDKSILFDNLFKDQIKDGSMLKREAWSELSPFPLTTRGEKIGNISKENRREFNLELNSLRWEERLNLSTNALKPFTNFKKLISGADYSWKAPN